VLEAPSCKGGTTSEYGEPLMDAISKLTGKLEISIKTNYPLRVLEKTEDSIVTVIVAPRVHEE